MGSGVNPWRELRARDHLVLEYGWLRGCRGMIVDHGEFRTIVLDSRLTQIERNAVLMHELVHDELDLFWCPRTPGPVIDKGERLVRRITAERLVPAAALARYVARTVDLGGWVTVPSVAAEFLVPEGVASDAVAAFQQSLAS